MIKNQQLDDFEIPCLTWGDEPPVNDTNTTEIAYDGFENLWSGGFGWSSGWYHEGDAKIVTSDGPYTDAHHLRLRRNNGYVDRVLDLSQYSSAALTLQVKVKSFERNDYADLLVSSDGVNWNVLRTFTPADSDNAYHEYSFDLTPYISLTTWIAIDAEMSGTGDYFYADEVRAESFL
ncbi:MAG: hypothetical protein ABH864_02615 [archaeon]